MIFRYRQTELHHNIYIIMTIMIIMIIMAYIHSARHIVPLWCLFCPALPLRYQTPPLRRFWELGEILSKT